MASSFRNSIPVTAALMGDTVVALTEIVMGESAMEIPEKWKVDEKVLVDLIRKQESDLSSEMRYGDGLKEHEEAITLYGRMAAKSKSSVVNVARSCPRRPFDIASQTPD